MERYQKFTALLIVLRNVMLWNAGKKADADAEPTLIHRS